MQKALFLIVIVALAGFASAASHEELHTLWTSWKSHHNKHYSTGEEAARFAIFVDNYYKVIAFNGENESPKLGLNRFADMTSDEWKSQYTGSAFVETNRKFVEENTMTLEARDLPDSFDWRPKGAVTPVKDQGQCGSCWSFSTTGTIEGLYFLNKGNLLSFSEQQIVDCDTTQNEGCNGGWPYLAVQYAAANGLEQENDYPYTAQDGQCVFDTSKATQVAKNYSFITPNSTDALKTAIVQQPVSVLIEADQNIFQLYKSGVIWRSCGNEIDHAVLAVGYGKSGTLNIDSIIVKNSWATTWGDEGYVYISSSEKANAGTGVCGILTQPMVAV